MHYTFNKKEQYYNFNEMIKSKRKQYEALIF